MNGVTARRIRAKSGRVVIIMGSCPGSSHRRPPLSPSRQSGAGITGIRHTPSRHSDIPSQSLCIFAQAVHHAGGGGGNSEGHVGKGKSEGATREVLGAGRGVKTTLLVAVRSGGRMIQAGEVETPAMAGQRREERRGWELGAEGDESSDEEYY